MPESIEPTQPGHTSSSKQANSDATDQTSSQQITKQKGSPSSNDKAIAVIGDEDTAIGFGLAGVKNYSVVNKDSDNAEIMKLINEFVNKPNIGFIIITQQIAERVREELEKLKLEKSLYPIFIELPDKTGELPGRVDPIRLLIRRAIGMEVVKGKNE
jgi:V/A-type H+-transporting ATPase subunit F